MTFSGPLHPTPLQRDALDDTLTAFSRACAHAAQVGQAAGTTGNAVIHRLCYHDLRARYGLTANLAVRAIARAAQQLKQGRRAGLAAEIPYDPRILRVEAGAESVSLSSVRGRLQGIPLDLPSNARRQLRRGRLLRALLQRTPDGAYHLALTLAASPASPPSA